MKASTPKLSSTRAKFIQKLHNAITLHDGPVVQWTLNQESFVVLQPETFCEVVLPTFCRHTSFASFERQLHFYRYVVVFHCSHRLVFYSPVSIPSFFGTPRFKFTYWSPTERTVCWTDVLFWNWTTILTISISFFFVLCQFSTNGSIWN